MDKISISTKLRRDDFIKVNYYLLYRRWVIKLLTGIGVLMLLSFGLTFISNSEFLWSQLLFGGFITAGLPILANISAKKNYKSNRRLSEPINYEFDQKYLHVIGESFNSKLTWDKIYSVTENKDWILIWQSRQVANVVPKRDFMDGQLESFKDFIKSCSGVKNKLK